MKPGQSRVMLTSGVSILRYPDSVTSRELVEVPANSTAVVLHWEHDAADKAFPYVQFDHPDYSHLKCLLYPGEYREVHS